METTSFEYINQRFELVPARIDLVTIHKEYIDNFLALENKVVKVLGRNLDTASKEIAIRGKATVQSKLNELMEKRKTITGRFNDIVKVFTTEEKKYNELIDRLQNFANECLKIEKQAIEKANELIQESKEKVIEELKETIQDENELAVSIAVENLKASTEILDLTKSRKKVDAIIVNFIGFVSLMGWAISNQEIQMMNQDELSSLTVQKLLNLYKKEERNPAAGILITVTEVAK